MTKQNETNKTDKPMAYDAVLCPVDIFRFFIRKHYSGIQISNDDCDMLRIDFAKWLHAKNLTDEQINNIMPKNTIDVILKTDHPFRSNGMPLAFTLHFCDYIEEMQKQAATQ